MKIFFLNVGRRYELVESFARALPLVSPGIIWGSDPNPLAPALALVDRVIDLPAKIESDEFLDCLCDFLKRESIDLIIPTIDPDLLRLDQWRDELTKRVPQSKVLLSPRSAIQVARNKHLSRDAFALLGAEVPEAVDPFDSDLAFPLFVKPASGSSSVGAVRVENAVELQKALKTTVDPMVERFVRGDEITVDVLLDLQGRALCAVPRRRLQVRAGEVTRGIVERSPKLESLAMALAEGIGCIGPVTIQFLNPVKDRWVAIELNARMGGGLPLSINAGANWPLWILQMINDDTPTIDSSKINDGMIMTRTDHSIFLPPKNLLPLEGIQKPLPQVLIFDMDDTLYPEVDFIYSGYRAVAERVWNDLRVDIESELRRRFTANQRGDLISTVFCDLGIDVGEEYVANILVPVYREHTPKILPFVEVESVLSELCKKGYRLGLLSDGLAVVQRRKFDALGLAQYFEKIIFTDELGRDAWKPSEKGFIHLLNSLEVEAVNTIYIADNPLKDFFGANALGMKTVRIIRPGAIYEKALPPSLAYKPQRVIYTLSELLNNSVSW
jgi:FMN phosphatase YigB (HAD superfamily)